MARAGLFSLMVGVVLMLALHVVPPTDQISPVRRTLSEYALGPNKWMFDVAVLAVALGSALLFGELVRRRAIRTVSAPVVFGALWTVSLLVIVAYPKNNWAIGPSMGGMVHRYASIVGWVALPLAVLLVARAAFPEMAGWRWGARAMALLTLGWFGAILVGVVNWLAGGVSWWRFLPLGIVERGLAASAAAAIGVVLVGMVRTSRVHSDTNQTPTAGSVPSLR
ncbi:MAG TPA: DUF998 domain-containing protein [Actinophytocola sp.]|uniref:DUF998 domain-containing protein n=1 Tax=Actinophytocola sp. TaxID=1872138 RepID=UPI002DBD5364|nr:DUF998 domain-containing protein [Actinophytocola sp.]HEU5472267.1 DUF998 domain-containing protein [Actinophytocola sp.]